MAQRISLRCRDRENEVYVVTGSNGAQGFQQRSAFFVPLHIVKRFASFSLRHWEYFRNYLFK
jgi:hypothetical protein